MGFVLVKNMIFDTPFYTRPNLNRPFCGVILLRYLGYGKSYWPEYRALFGGMNFAPRGQFLVGKAAGLTVVLTDHFTAQSMNGKLDDVVSILKG